MKEIREYIMDRVNLWVDIFRISHHLGMAAVTKRVNKIVGFTLALVFLGVSLVAMVVSYLVIIPTAYILYAVFTRIIMLGNHSTMKGATK